MTVPTAVATSAAAPARTSKPTSTVIAGVDGCPAGWIVVSHPPDRPHEAQVELFETFAQIVTDPRAFAVIAIDIPIGLPEVVGIGGRDADISARKVLGARQSAIFAIPSRRAVFAASYANACDAALQTSDPPRKISKQAYNIFPKIREVDKVVTPQLQSRVFEVHPEVAFWALNGCCALNTPKKVKSRPNPAGLDQRRDLLKGVGYQRVFLDAVPFKRRIAGPDDILDATANAHTAAKIGKGTAIRFPDEPTCDIRGLRMEIWG